MYGRGFLSVSSLASVSLIGGILYTPASQASGPAAVAEPTRFQSKKPYVQIIKLGGEYLKSQGR